MPPKMHPPHPTGFEQMRKRPLQQLPPASQQATAPRPANPAPVGIHGVAGRRLALPASAAPIRLREVGAQPHRLQVHQRLVAVVPGCGRNGWLSGSGIMNHDDDRFTTAEGGAPPWASPKTVAAGSGLVQLVVHGRCAVGGERFGDLASRPTVLHDAGEVGSRDADRETLRAVVHVIHDRAPASREATDASNATGIGICTLYAPYASEASRGRTRRAPVSIWRIRRKSGAGERTRTADLLITNQLLYQLSYAGFLPRRVPPERRVTAAGNHSL